MVSSIILFQDCGFVEVKITWSSLTKLTTNIGGFLRWECTSTARMFWRGISIYLSGRKMVNHSTSGVNTRAPTPWTRGRKGGPKTAKPRRNTPKNRKPHQILSRIPKPHVHGGPITTKFVLFSQFLPFLLQRRLPCNHYVLFAFSCDLVRLYELTSGMEFH